MQNHDLAMFVFAKLARISHEKRQSAGRDRFLLLTGERACLGGWPVVAEKCRELVLLSNPRHLLSRTPAIADCLRSEEGARFFPTLHRFCTFERAEHLLSGLEGPSDGHPGDFEAASLQELIGIDIVPPA